MPDRPANKVLLIGWDAADWKVAAPLMDQGQMPNLERLVNGGVMGNLSTLYPVLSPMLWTSIATGKHAHKHGVHGFAEPDMRSGGVRPITNLSRTCKAVWNILQQNGLKSNVVGWWPSYPAEPISGVMVSNHFQDATEAYGKEWPVKPHSVHPPRLARQLGKFRVHPGELAEQQVLPFVPKLAELNDEAKKGLSGLMNTLAHTASIQSVATAIMQHEPWDFMAVYFDGIDHFCHGFMKYHPPRLDWVPEQEYEWFKDVINTAYKFHDMMLGALLTLAGEDTTVIVMSDHGFHSDHLRPQFLPNEPAGPADEHRGFGIFVMRGAGIKQDELIHGASLLDITPTLLTLFGLPIGSDMDGKALTQAFVEPPEPEWIESWEGVPGDCGRHPPELQVDLVAAEESMQQLVALGYIDKPDEDRDKAVAQTIRELRYNLARNYMASQKLPEAIELFQILWDDFPDEGRFGVKLFECQLQSKQTTAASLTFDRLIEEKQRYAQIALSELAELKEKWKDKTPEDWTQPERMKLRGLQRKATVNPSTMAYLRGSLLHAQSYYADALIELTLAEQVELHNRPSLYNRIGDCHIGLKQWDAALECYHKILAWDPLSVDARIGLARAHLGLEQNREALREATAAVGLIYHHPLGHYLRGRALCRLRRYKSSVDAFEVAIAQHPVFPQAHRRLAHVYELANRPIMARKHRRLAKAAMERISTYQAGGSVPSDQDLQLDLLWKEPIRINGVSGGRIGHRSGQPIGPDTVVIVSGLPRSGTSMMMQMLEAGGVMALTDGERAADSDNPRGYMEFEPAKKPDEDKSWVEDARGKSVKMIAHLLSGLPAGPDYRIVFMERCLADVVQSQRAMLERLQKQGARIPDRRLAATFRRQVEDVRRYLMQHPDRFTVLGIDYDLSVAMPAVAAAQLNMFFGGTLDEVAMAAAVNPALRRQGGGTV